MRPQKTNMTTTTATFVTCFILVNVISVTEAIPSWLSLRRSDDQNHFDTSTPDEMRSRSSVATSQSAPSDGPESGARFQSISIDRQAFSEQQTSVPVSGEPRVQQGGATSQQQQLSPLMELQKIVNDASNKVTCNDGSRIGYYRRLNEHSKSWVIFLQGGGYCSSDESCQRRWQQSPNLMSSKFWPETMSVDGILSSEPRLNPYLWNANHIYVPYCSSDSWSGLSYSADSSIYSALSTTHNHSTSSGNKKFAFMGSRIVERVFHSLYDDLPANASLFGAKFILLAGESAGAAGAVMNLDKINDLIGQKLLSNRANCSLGATDCRHLAQRAPLLRGLADSGWFIDNEPYNMPGSSANRYSNNKNHNNRSQSKALDCERQICRPVEAIRQAMLYWNGQVPENCSKQYRNEPWLCYFAYRTYQTLRTPLFVVQWLYDEAQLMADNFYLHPDSQAEWNYVKRVAQDLRNSLENVTAIFAPSCIAHSMITRKSWNQISINGLKLPHILNTWEEQSLAEAAGNGDRQQDSSMVDTQNTEHLQSQTENLMTNQQNDNDSTLSLAFESPQGQVSRLQMTRSFGNQNENISRPLRSANNNNSRQRVSRKRKRGNQQQQQLQQASSTALTNSNGGGTKSSTSNNNNSRHRFNYQSGNSATSPAANPTQSPPNFHHLIPMIASQSSNVADTNDQTQSSNDSGNIISQTRDSSGSTGRQGRSASIEEATLVLSNNVPDDEHGSLIQMTNGEPTITQDRDGSRWIVVSSGAPFEHMFQPLQTSQFSNRFADTISSSKYQIGESQAAKSTTYFRMYQFNRFRLIDSCSWPQCNRECPRVESDVLTGGLTIY